MQGTNKVQGLRCHINWFMGYKVALRQKEISGNKFSLYLDFWPAIKNPESGKWIRRKFLRLYIFKNPSGALQKKHNTDQLEIANAIRFRRENELNKPEIYSAYEQELLRRKVNGERDFVAYFKELAFKRKESNHDNWMSAYNYLARFTGGELKFKELNQKFLEDFKSYLLTTKSVKSDKAKLASGSASSYFNKIKATLKQAYKEGVLEEDLNSKVKPIKVSHSRREFLTLEELTALARTECNDKVLKRAALFSAMTGLRFSDIRKLRWSEICLLEGRYYLKFTQQKTESVEFLPIGAQAYELTAGKDEPGEMPQESAVFPGLRYSAYHNRHLFQWLGAGGITRHITFHCFRHTFATLQLSMDTSITTIQKMLGHKDLKTTMIYAKVLDRAQQEAADKIRLEL